MSAQRLRPAHPGYDTLNAGPAYTSSQVSVALTVSRESSAG